MTSPLYVNYDAIAHLYDTQPYRAKSVDAELLAFVEQRFPAASLSILDIGCGTGNQLLANRAVVPQARLAGVDRSLGTLRQAQSFDFINRHYSSWNDPIKQPDRILPSWQAEKNEMLSAGSALFSLPGEPAFTG